MSMTAPTPAHGGMAGMDMGPSSVSSLRKLGMTLLTLLLLGLGYWLARQYGDLQMRAGARMTFTPGMSM